MEGVSFYSNRYSTPGINLRLVPTSIRKCPRGTYLKKRVYLTQGSGVWEVQEHGAGI